LPGLRLLVSETNTHTSEHVYSDLLQVLVHLSGTAGTVTFGFTENGNGMETGSKNGNDQ